MSVTDPCPRSLRNQKKIGLALLFYEDSQDVFPYAHGYNGTYTWAWSALILPYIEEASVYDQCNFDIGYNTVGNRQAIKQAFYFHQCLSAPPNGLVSCCASIPGMEDTGETNYAAISHYRRYTNFWGGSSGPPAKNEVGVMHYNSQVKMREIIDGTSKTFYVGEVDPDQDDVLRPPIQVTALLRALLDQCGPIRTTSRHSTGSMPTSTGRRVASIAIPPAGPISYLSMVT